MAVTFDVTGVLDLYIRKPLLLPAIRGWNRLEGRPRSEDFERSLRAEVRDPMWFLARQWQLGELTGDDAGSPIDARLATRHVSIATSGPANGTSTPHDAAVPLETTVEREAVVWDLLTLRQVTGALWRALGDAPGSDSIRQFYRTTYPLTEQAIAGHLDIYSSQVLPLALEHFINGATLLAEIRSGEHTARISAMDASTQALLSAAADRITAWFVQLYGAPPSTAPATWVPERLEYQFACSVSTDAGERTLAARSYTEGHLDWFAFDVARAPAAGAQSAAEEFVTSFIPAPTSFAGMPGPRYWQMDDRKTELSDIDAHTTDVAKLLLAEFALIHGDDWCVVPLEVDIGRLVEIRGLVVTDVFGEQVVIEPAGRGRDESWRRWSMFALSTEAEGDVVKPSLFVPPTVGQVLSGAPLEKVAFLRDDAAGLAWAVVSRVPSALGVGLDGKAVGRDLSPPPEDPPQLPEGVGIGYSLGSDVPATWRPFLPVRSDPARPAIRLRRARLHGPTPPMPGHVLDVPSPYDLFEEEVPRAGVQVTRAFQRARWIDGSVHLWIGRRAATGRGEGTSGLSFDQIYPPSKGG